MRRRVLPRLDGRRAFDGDIAPVVELDDRDSRSARPCNVSSFTVRGRAATPTLPSNTAVDTIVACARPLAVTVAATPV